MDRVTVWLVRRAAPIMRGCMLGFVVACGLTGFASVVAPLQVPGLIYSAFMFAIGAGANALLLRSTRR